MSYVWQNCHNFLTNGAIMKSVRMQFVLKLCYSLFYHCLHYLIPFRSWIRPKGGRGGGDKHPDRQHNLWTELAQGHFQRKSSTTQRQTIAFALTPPQLFLCTYNVVFFCIDGCMACRGTALTPDNLINGLDKISQFPIIPDLPPPCLPSAGTTDQEYAARSQGLICVSADIKCISGKFQCTLPKKFKTQLPMRVMRESL